jgi:uncharacterized membrane-anchored protein YhcB (DUF1043 family)
MLHDYLINYFNKGFAAADNLFRHYVHVYHQMNVSSAQLLVEGSFSAVQ